MNYLSPYVIMDAASQGIVNGSLIFFTLLFLSSLFLGRFWCGWLCPGSGLNNLCGLVKPEPAKLGRRDLVKYVTWSLWIIVIAYLAYSAGGYRVIDPFYLTDHGISVTEPANYVIYFGIVGLILALNLVFGRGAMCHYLCWMAPFMVIGSRVKNTLNYPSLHLNAEKDNCINCGLCTRNCPRGLPVQEMVQDTKMNHDECILCGTCVDNCPKKAISYSWTK
jgi:polyferredoxin